MKKYITLKLLITATFSLILIITLTSVLTKKIIILAIVTGISLIILTLLTLLFISNTTNKMYLNEIKLEIKNIHWPQKKEINQSMLITTVIILLSGLILWIIDSMLTFLISKII